MKEPLISIIVPIYNMQDYLEKCVKSIQQQTYKNIEIILVNDGSTDSSKEICEKLKNEDSRIKIINKDNGGLSSAKNAGINAATGDYIGFVDSDDHIEKNMYEFLYNLIIRNDADISICGRYIELENGKIYQKQKSKTLVMDTLQALIVLNSYRDFDMASWDKLYKKELFDNIKFPIGKLCEDFFTTYQLFDKCKTIVYSSEPKYYYFQRNNSISRNKKINFFSLEASKSQVDFFNRKYPKVSYVAKTANAFSYIAVYNAHIKQGVLLTREFKNICKRELMKNYISILKNGYIPFYKKVQATVFILNFKIYNKIILKKERI